MATPTTNFAVKEKYKYHEGLGNYHSSEAAPNAIPVVNNTPQKPAYGLRTERISGTSFTASRHHNLQTWMYRIKDSLDHGTFTPLGVASSASAPSYMSPNSYMWRKLPTGKNLDYVFAQTLLAGAGDPATKTGLAIHTFSITKSMPSATAFSSLDGDLLIIPQSGSLDIRTELGYLLVRQNEICVIPRGIRHHVSLIESSPCRGYLVELFQSHFRLPELGIVGSTGLANIRDFQIPTASFDGMIDPTSQRAVQNNSSTSFTIITRQNRTLWSCTQSHTPFNIVAWHGTLYPYKYDLARFCILNNALFDHHDPSLYVVLTAPIPGDEGGSICDFAIIPPRWAVAENTFWLPYFHRNTCSEFYGPIINSQDPNHRMNSGNGADFKPFAAGLNGSMVTHGPSEDDHHHAQNAPTTPTKVATDGITIFLIETELPLMLTEYGKNAAMENFKVKSKGANKL